MRKERDSQRARVYKSDAALIAIAKPLPSVAEVERYVKRVFGMKRVQDAFPKAVSCHWLPKVGDGRGRRAACGSAHEIKIPRFARNEAVVLHELAHTICRREHGYVAGHGWQFCAIYLRLTLYVMGREAHDVLKQAMKENRVRFTAPRKRQPMDPERKAALVARLHGRNTSHMHIGAERTDMIDIDKILPLPEGLAFLRYVAETLPLTYGDDPGEHEQLQAELRQRLSTEQGIRRLIGLRDDDPPMPMADMLTALVMQAMIAQAAYGKAFPWAEG